MVNPPRGRPVRITLYQLSSGFSSSGRAVPQLGGGWPFSDEHHKSNSGLLSSIMRIALQLRYWPSRSAALELGKAEVDSLVPSCLFGSRRKELIELAFERTCFVYVSCRCCWDVEGRGDNRASIRCVSCDRASKLTRLGRNNKSPPTQRPNAKREKPASTTKGRKGTQARSTPRE
jgi:hypothetical protein